MSYEKTDFKTGWSEKAWIEIKKTSIYGFISDFKCKKSGNKLEAESLFVSRTNFKHRGNETDQLYFYNRDYTPEKYMRVWDEWDETKADKITEIKEIAKEYNIKLNVRI